MCYDEIGVYAQIIDIVIYQLLIELEGPLWSLTKSRIFVLKIHISIL